MNCVINLSQPGRAKSLVAGSYFLILIQTGLLFKVF